MSSRTMRTGDDERLSGAVSTASGRAKPRSFSSISTIACAMVSVTFFGRHCRILDGTTPVVKLGFTNESFFDGRSARKSPTSWQGAV